MFKNNSHHKSTTRISAMLLSVLIATVSAFTFTACNEVTDVSGSQSGGEIIEFTDSTGRLVTLDKAPGRVAVLFASFAEIWKLAGGEVAVTVGDSVERGFAGEDAVLVDQGAGMNINTELLAAAAPDFVIASADTAAQVNACEVMRAAGVPCALLSVETFEQYLQTLKIFTDITGNKDAYRQYGTDVSERVSSVLSRCEESAEEANVLFVRGGTSDSSTKAKTARDHFVGVMLEQLGAHNIADDATALSQGLSLEHVLICQPDVILIVTHGDEQAATEHMNELLTQSGWRDLEAVKSGRVYFLDRELFHYKPNARWDEAYSVLASLLYPEGEND